jgi:hypothetical protein
MCWYLRRIDFPVPQGPSLERTEPFGELAHIPQNSNVVATNSALLDSERAILVKFLIFHLTFHKVGQNTVLLATTALSD